MLPSTPFSTPFFGLPRFPKVTACAVLPAPPVEMKRWRGNTRLSAPGGCDGHHEMSDLGAAGEPVHSGGASVESVWPHQRSEWSALACTEKIMSKTYTGHLSQKRLYTMFHATNRTKLGRQVNKFLKKHPGGRFESPPVVIRDAAVPVSPAPERLNAFIRAVFASIWRRVVSSVWPRTC